MAADQALALALAAGATVADAARRAGVSERTAYRRLDDPAFRAQMQQTRTAMVERAVGQLADAATEAVQTLRSLLHADAESARLGAAKAVLEIGARWREAGELEQRIAQLEEQSAWRNGSGGTRQWPA